MSGQTQRFGIAAVRGVSFKSLLNIRRPTNTAKYSAISSKKLPPKPARSYKFLEILSEREHWLREVLYLVFAASMISAIAAILKKSDGESIEKWNYKITLGTVLSSITSLLWLCLNTVVANCILQLRWNRFRSTHSLYDFEKHDRAGRGINGSLQLLFSLGADLLTRSGALLLILIFAIGPLTQQLLAVSSQEAIVARNASLPVAYHIATNLSQDGLALIDGGTDSFAAELGTSIFSAMFSSNVPGFTDDLNCASGNCTWNNFTTLAFKVSVRNVTDQLKRVDGTQLTKWLKSSSDALQRQEQASSDWTISPWQMVHLTNSTRGITFEDVFGGKVNENLRVSGSITGQGIESRQYAVTSVQPVYMDLAYMTPKTADETADLLLSPDVFNIFVYYQEFELNTTFVYEEVERDGLNATWNNVSLIWQRSSAWACDFSLVLQSKNASVTNGRFKELDIGTPTRWPFRTPASRPNDTLSSLNDIYHVGDIEYKIDIDDFYETLSGMISPYENSNEWGISGTSIRVVQNRSLGDVKTSEKVSISSATSIVGSYMHQIAQGDVAVAYGFGNRLLNASVETVMENIAQGLTNRIRTLSGNHTSGNVTTTVAAYSISWPWLSVPVVLWFVATFLVLATAVDTRRKNMPVWTDSTLAVLIHGVEGGLRTHLQHEKTALQLEQASKRVRVELGGSGFALEVRKIP